MDYQKMLSDMNAYLKRPIFGATTTGRLPVDLEYRVPREVHERNVSSVAAHHGVSHDRAVLIIAERGTPMYHFPPRTPRGHPCADDRPTRPQEHTRRFMAGGQHERL